MSEITINIKEKLTKYMYNVGSYFLIIAIIVYLYFQIRLASNDSKAFTKKFVYYILTIVLPIILIFFLLVVTSFENTVNKYIIISSIAICFIMFLVFYFFKTRISGYIFNNYFLYGITLLLLLFGLAIIYTIFSVKLKRLNGWTGFFVNLIFYIPCLIRDFIQTVIQEYNGLSFTIVILFVLELLLILMYFYIVPLIQDKTFPDKIIILENPSMLNSSMELENKLSYKDNKNNNFGLSFWVFLNAMPNSKLGYNKETTIFNYNDTNKNPHIKLSYLNTERGNNDFILYIGKNKFSISLPIQKWNNFVINFVTYSDPTATIAPAITPSEQSTTITTPIPTLPSIQTVDIFINGNLERSVTLKGQEFQSFVETDRFIIGGDDASNLELMNNNGLYGSICNIVYYKKPLSKLSLVYNYNLLTVKNPPI